MADERFGGMLGMMQGLEEPEEVELIDITRPGYWEDAFRSILAKDGAPYYQLMKRPMDKIGGSILTHIFSGRPFDYYHYQFVNPDGRNFGFGKDRVFREDRRQYSSTIWPYFDMKFDADIIDKAKNAYDAKMASDQKLADYNFFRNNCHDYAYNILLEALRQANGN